VLLSKVRGLFFLHLDLLKFHDEVQVLQVEEYDGEWLLRKAIGRLQLFAQAEISPDRFNRCQFSPVHRRRLLAMQAYQYFTRKLLKHALKIKMSLMKCMHPFTKSQRIRVTGHDAV
jgi:hypothetical protein